MAYIDQARKAQIAAELKKVVPAGWKYSLAVRHHTTLAMTISEAPVDIIAACKLPDHAGQPPTELGINPYHAGEHFVEGPVRDAILAILAAMNTGNHDRSDPQSDYYDVGWYVDVRVGRWDRPFKVTAPAVAA